jgi:hypothetical protein
MAANFLKGDCLGGLFWLLLGISLCVESINLKLGSFHRPGPGFMPFISGAFLVLFGLILTGSAVSRRLDEQDNVRIKEISLKTDWKSSFANRKNVLLTLGALFGYAALLNRLGFLVVTYLFIFFLSKIAQPKKWVLPLAFSGIVVALSYLIFSVWLGLRLPRGIFRFWMM